MFRCELICGTSPWENPGKQFWQQIFNILTKKFPKIKKNLAKLSYSAQKLQFRTILFPYKLCVKVEKILEQRVNYFLPSSIFIKIQIKGGKITLQS